MLLPRRDAKLPATDVARELLDCSLMPSCPPGVGQIKSINKLYDCRLRHSPPLARGPLRPHSRSSPDRNAHPLYPVPRRPRPAPAGRGIHVEQRDDNVLLRLCSTLQKPWPVVIRGYIPRSCARFSHPDSRSAGGRGAAAAAHGSIKVYSPHPTHQVSGRYRVGTYNLVAHSK